MLGMRGKTIFIADTLMHFRPDAEQMADIAIGAARAARASRPRAARRAAVAFHVRRPAARPADAPMRDAVAILDRRKVDFEYDGEMSPDVALEPSHPRAVSVLPADRAMRMCW